MAEASAKLEARNDYEGKSERVTHRPQIIGLLRRLKDSHNLLSVRVEGSERYFTSMLLEVDSQEGYILLDQISDRKGHELAVEHGRLRAFCQCHGVDLNFEARIRAVRDEQGLIVYRAPLPEWVNYLQRRADFRVRVAMNSGLVTRMELEDGQSLEARLHDLSMGGAGLVLETRLDFRTGFLIPRLVIRREKEKETLLDTPCEVRFQLDRDNGQKRIGLRFVDPDPEQKRKLRKLVTQLEREMLRHKPRD